MRSLLEFMAWYIDLRKQFGMPEYTDEQIERICEAIEGKEENDGE